MSWTHVLSIDWPAISLEDALNVCGGGDGTLQSSALAVCVHNSILRTSVIVANTKNGQTIGTTIADHSSIKANSIYTLNELKSIDPMPQPINYIDIYGKRAARGQQVRTHRRARHLKNALIISIADAIIVQTRNDFDDEEKKVFVFNSAPMQLKVNKKRSIDRLIRWNARTHAKHTHAVYVRPVMLLSAHPHQYVVYYSIAATGLGAVFFFFFSFCFSCVRSIAWRIEWNRSNRCVDIDFFQFSASTRTGP